MHPQCEREREREWLTVHWCMSHGHVIGNIVSLSFETPGGRVRSGTVLLLNCLPLAAKADAFFFFFLYLWRKWCVKTGQGYICTLQVYPRAFSIYFFFFILTVSIDLKLFKDLMIKRQRVAWDYYFCVYEGFAWYEPKKLIYGIW